jgi:hypothetical protein
LLLKEGVSDLFGALPDVSHMRRPLVHYVGGHLPTSVAADWCHTSESTVKGAHKLTTVDIDKGLLKVERFVPDTHHLEHFFGKEMIVFLIFLEEKYPCPSPTHMTANNFFNKIQLSTCGRNTNFG